MLPSACRRGAAALPPRSPALAVPASGASLPPRLARRRAPGYVTPLLVSSATRAVVGRGPPRERAASGGHEPQWGDAASAATAAFCPPAASQLARASRPMRSPSVVDVRSTKDKVDRIKPSPSRSPFVVEVRMVRGVAAVAPAKLLVGPTAVTAADHAATELASATIGSSCATVQL